MAKKISAKDIFQEEDIFLNIRKSAEDTIVSLGKINAEFKKTASTLKSTIGQTKLDSTKNIKEFILLTEKANKLAQESAKVEALRQKAIQQSAKATQEIEKATQQKSRTEQQNIRTARELQRAEEQKARAQERSAKTAKDEANVYKQLEKATRDLKNQSKELGAEMLRLEMAGQKNSAEYRKLSIIYSDVTKKAQQGDAQLKKLDKTVGDNFRNVGNYEKAMNGFNKTLSVLGIGFGVGSVLKTGAESIIEFNQSIADLQAITGAGGKDLEYFAEQANNLGIGVEGGASAVVEAYKLIGSAKPELLSNAKALDAVAQSAITLSQASGMTLPESATALTDAMNQFGASAEEADKFVNVLANGAKFGSAEIPQITEALLKFGAVAKSTGTSVEESTAMIELLAEKGLKGAEAGTALRNVMLKLSAPDALPKEAKSRLEDLGISLKELSNPALSITEKLKMLAPLMKDNGALMKTFGTENAVSALSLIQNTKRIDELNESMKTNGTSTQQAKERTNTLGHAIMELKNSFTGLFTSIGGGSNAMQSVIDGFKFIGANMTNIVSIIWKVTRTWLLYKGTLKAIEATNWIANGGFKQLGVTMLKQIPMTRAYRLEQLTLARANKSVGDSAIKGGESMKTAGNAMKAIPWVLIITSLVELYNWWANVASASAEARRQADLYKKAKEDGQQKALALSEMTKESYDEEIKKSELLYRKRIAMSKSAEERTRLEKESAEASIKIQDKYINKARLGAEDQQHNLNVLRAQYKSWLPLKQEFDKSGGLSVAQTQEQERIFKVMKQYGVVFSEFGSSSEVLTALKKKIAETSTSLSQYKADMKSFKDVQDEANVSMLESDMENYKAKIDKVDESAKKVKGSMKEFATQLSDVNDYLSESVSLMQELEEIFQNRELVKLTEDIDAIVEKAVADVEAGKQAFGLTLKTAKTPEEEKATDKANLDLLLASNTELNKKIDEKYQLEKKILEQRASYAKMQLELANENQKAEELNKILAERQKLLSQEGLSPADKAKIEADYKSKLAQLDIENAQRDTDLKQKKLILDEKLADDTNRLEKDKVKTKEDANKKILDSTKQHDKDMADSKAKKDAKEIESEKKKQETIQTIISETFDYFKKKSEEKIAQLEKEMGLAQKQYDYYQALAENGNIQASQSMAEQQKIIEDANKKKAQEEKKQAYMELAKTAYATYQSKVDAKSEKPLADTIKDISLLQAFIRTIPAFEDGIEDTGTNGRGVDGKGGFHAILHPNERVVPKDLNQKIGSLSNTELAQLATNYRAGKIGDANQSGSSLDLAILVNEIKDLKSVIQNKPEMNIELGRITQSAMEIVQQTRVKNKTTINTFKVNS